MSTSLSLDSGDLQSETLPGLEFDDSESSLRLSGTNPESTVPSPSEVRLSGTNPESTVPSPSEVHEIDLSEDLFDSSVSPTFPRKKPRRSKVNEEYKFPTPSECRRNSSNVHTVDTAPKSAFVATMQGYKQASIDLAAEVDSLKQQNSLLETSTKRKNF
ncbi:hypothetical protein MAR_013780 [Mya arenaria]|uniref:Uncharacterized protein n=1 Tax=Mya arenaria TaxID=6604 RepID=A0ABY7GA16_MYAAR|nr:hypothetical protein MAR_013780 [Mya arenaria]